MTNENVLRKKLKNAEGKRLLKKTILEFSKEIIGELIKYPEELSLLLEELEMSEEEFFSYVSGEKVTNISFYDQTYSLLATKKR